MKRTILSIICAIMLLSGALAEDSATVTVDGVGERVTVTLTMEDDRIVGVDASTDNSEADERGRESLELITSAMVEKNTFSVDAVSGATCTSNAVIAGAIEAWMQITANRMSGEDWMRESLENNEIYDIGTADEAEAAGWENTPHSAAELPSDAQMAFEKASEGKEYVPVALMSTQGSDYCILCQDASLSWVLVYIHTDSEGSAKITNTYELYIDRHSTPAEK